MDANANRHAVNIGSGRARLPETPQFDGIMFGPGMTTTAREALSLDTGDAGLVVFDNVLAALVLFDGTDWINLDGTALA